MPSVMSRVCQLFRATSLLDFLFHTLERALDIHAQFTTISHEDLCTTAIRMIEDEEEEGGEYYYPSILQSNSIGSMITCGDALDGTADCNMNDSNAKPTVCRQKIRELLEDSIHCTTSTETTTRRNLLSSSLITTTNMEIVKNKNNKNRNQNNKNRGSILPLSGRMNCLQSIINGINSMIIGPKSYVPLLPLLRQQLVPFNYDTTPQKNSGESLIRFLRAIHFLYKTWLHQLK